MPRRLAGAAAGVGAAVADATDRAVGTHVAHLGQPPREAAQALAWLLGLLSAPPDGRGGALFVTGDPGSGKTFLLAHGLRLASERGISTVSVTCLPVSDSLPLDPVRSLLSQLPRSGRTGIPPDASTEQLAARTLSGLEESSLPLLVALDDLHWAGATAVAVFQSAAMHLSDLPIAWLHAGRPTPAVCALGRHLRKHLLDAQECRLRPLDVTEVATLLAAQLGSRVTDDLAAVATARTCGNPLLCVTLAAASRGGAGSLDCLLTQGAGSLALGDVVNDWLEHLDPEVVDGLKYACILPEVFRSSWLTSLAGQPAGTDLAEVASTGLLEHDDRGWRFRHPLLREALYADLPSLERQRRHREAVAVMEGEPCHLRAPQLAGAGLVAEAARAYRETGELVYDRGGAEDACHPFEQAVRFAEEAGDRATSRDARLGLALALLRAGRQEEADALALSLRDELRRAGDVARHVRLCSRFGLALWDEASDLDKSKKLLEEADAVLVHVDRADEVDIGPRELAEAELAQAMILDRNGDPGVALGHAERALAEAAAAGDPTLSIRVRNRLGLFLGEVRGTSEAISCLEPVAADAAEAGLGAEAALAFLNLSYFSEVSGDVAGFARYARDGLALADVPPSIEAMLRGNLSFAAMNRGELDVALAQQLAARRVAARAGPRTEDRVVVGLVHVHVRRGDLLAARRLLANLAFPVGSFEERRMLEARGMLEEESGRPADARTAYAAVAAAPNHPGAAWCLAGIVRTALALGDSGDAEKAERTLASLEGRWPAVHWLLAGSRGWLASYRGDKEGARHFDEARATASEAFESARFGLEAACLRRDVAGIAAAVRTYESMGARRAADRARWVARELCVVVPRLRRRVGPLSRRELEVAQLVASGQRNSEIAKFLFLSERTVERHVSNVLTKLDLRSRVDLATMVASGKLPGNVDLPEVTAPRRAAAP